MSLIVVLCALMGISIAHDIHPFFPMNEDTNGTDTTGNSSLLGICYGSSTSWSEYPYMAALRFTSGSACCSASIISLNPGILLTAAHCSGCSGEVRIGCNDPSSCDGDSYTIDEFIAHPDYPGGSYGMSSDVAVIKLSSEITTELAVAQIIPNAEPTLGNLLVVGYGYTETGSLPSELQYANIAIIDREVCKDIMEVVLGSDAYIDDTMICIRGGSAGDENVPTTCSGDSGGPWNFGDDQAGITSWVVQGSGTGCDSCTCCTGYPSVGTNVAYFAEWIDTYVNTWIRDTT